MLIAMAGLPGTGKSTLAASIAASTGGVVLSKDVVRAALFPPSVLDYSATQDDIAMAAVFAAARQLLTKNARAFVILDGRTFRKARQVAELIAIGHDINQEPFVIECVCDDAMARQRLKCDAESGVHLAGNRTADLHDIVKATAEPLTIARVTLDTGKLSTQECLAQVLPRLQRQYDSQYGNRS